MLLLLTTRRRVLYVSRLLLNETDGNPRIERRFLVTFRCFAITDSEGIATAVTAGLDCGPIFTCIYVDFLLKWRLGVRVFRLVNYRVCKRLNSRYKFISKSIFNWVFTREKNQTFETNRAIIKFGIWSIYFCTRFLLSQLRQRFQVDNSLTQKVSGQRETFTTRLLPLFKSGAAIRSRVHPRITLIGKKKYRASTRERL